MVTQELLDYVQGEMTRGIEKDAIIQALVTSGWSIEDANSAVSALAQQPQPPPQMPPVAPIVSAPQTAPQTAAPVIAPATTPVTAERAPITPSRQPASGLEAKAAKIEMAYDTAVEKVNEIGGAQRQIVTDSVKKLEERKIDEIKKRLLPS